jgi:hypothetical protein
MRSGSGKRGKERQQDIPGDTEDTVIEVNQTEISGGNPDIKGVDNELVPEGGTSTGQKYNGSQEVV